MPPISKIIAAAVLTGGKSSRLGRDKSLLRYQGKTLAALMVSKLLKAGYDPVFVVGPKKAYGLPKGTAVVPDRKAGLGPLAGIQAALFHAGKDCLVVGCDFPKIGLGLFRKLRRWHKPGEKISAIKSLKGLEPLLAIYSPKLLPELKRRLARKELAVWKLVRRFAKSTHFFFYGRRLFNLNTLSDLQRLLK